MLFGIKLLSWKYSRKTAINITILSNKKKLLLSDNSTRYYFFTEKTSKNQIFTFRFQIIFA